jgi:pimeloyl-ACP methyl ester carboxylesterase
MANPVPTKPALLLFIHGIGSSPETAWGNFPQLVRTDAALFKRYHIDVFDYPTALTGQGYPVTDIAQFLQTRMETDWCDYPEVAIIAHSQGGLVARRYIADCFNNMGRCRVRRVLFFATPHGGALLPKLSSKVPFAGSFLHPQTLGLAYDSPELRALYLAEAACDAHLRVRTKFVVAAEDDFVTTMSAWGSHGPGDYLVVPRESHGSLVKPEDKDYSGFRIAREFLLEEDLGGAVEADHRQALLKQKWRAEQSKAEAERDRFLYSARSIPLIGRDQELAQIKAFLGDPSHRFAWMILHGPGGMGKSRLALEVILGTRDGWWNSGFLDDYHDGPDWSVWQPRLPTFIVIDYAASAPDKLKAVIAALAEREGVHQLRQPVRLLLIERKAVGPWLDGILASSHKGKSCRAPNLELRPLVSLWPVFEHVWAWSSPEVDVPDQQETLRRFTELDPQQRPLFAMLMADAIARHGLDRQWSREGLLEDVLAREREKFWRPIARSSGLDPQHIEKEERALAIATIANGMPIQSLRAMPEANDDLLPRWRRDAHKLLFEAMTGIADDTILPLEPDIVGEYFVLHQLQHMSDSAKEIMEICWRNAPMSTGLFVDRCAEDFYDHPAFCKTYSIRLATSEIRLAWAILVPNLIRRINPIRDPNQTETLYQELRDLARAYPNETELREMYAYAVPPMIYWLGANGRVGDAQKIYEELRELAGSHPSEPELREMQSEALFVLVRRHCSGLLTNRTTALKLYDELRELAREHPQESKLRRVRAKTVSCMIAYASIFDKVDPVTEELLDELRNLTRDHANEPELRLELANAIANLVLVNGRDNPAICGILYQEMQELAREYPSELKDGVDWIGKIFKERYGREPLSS